MSVSKLLNEAYKNQYALGAFNCYSFETAKAVVKVSERNNIPALIAFGSKYLANMEYNEIRAVVDSLKVNSKVDVFLHLDHTSDIELIKKAIENNFDSVMYDGSRLSFEENLENTKKVVELAHGKNISVEAELGSIAIGEDSHEGFKGDIGKYTDPEKAEIFVKETNVDFLAVSIGTVHGNYIGEPEIRIDILKEINKRLQIPLVLHGGSGTPEDKIIESINNGISKINVNTEISTYTVEKTKEFLESNKVHLSELYLKQQGFMEVIIENYIKLFKNN